MKHINRIAVGFFLLLNMFILCYFYADNSNQYLEGMNQKITITSWKRQDGRDKTLELIKNLSKEYQINVYKEVNDSVNLTEQNERTFFVFEGDSTTNASFTESFRSFARGTKTVFQSIDKMKNEDIKGVYYLSEDSPDFLQKLVDSGVTFDYLPKPSSPLMRLFTEMIDINETICRVNSFLLIVIFFSFVYLKIYSLKKDSILIMLGYAKTQITSEDINNFFSMYYKINGTILLIMTLFLGVYNRWSHYFSLLFSFLGFSLFTAIICLFFLINAPALAARKQHTVNSLKGEKSDQQILIVNMVFKLILMIFLFVFIFQNLSELNSYMASLKVSEHWSSLPNYYVSDIDDEGSISSTSQESSGETETPSNLNSILQNAIHEEEKDGAILSWWKKATGNESTPLGQDAYDPWDPYYGGVLMVNNNYLKNNKVVTTKNKRIEKISFNQTPFYIIVPDQYKDDEILIKHKFISWYNQEFNVSKEDSDSEEIDLTKDVSIEGKATIIYSKSNQTYFTYYSEKYNLDDTFSKDLVLYVMGTDSFPEDSSFYLNAMKNQALFMENTDPVTKAIKNAGLDAYIFEPIRVQPIVNRQLVSLKNELLFKIFTTAILFITILFISYFVTSIYTESLARKHFIQKTFGYSFLRMHGLFLGSQLIISFTALYLLVKPNKGSRHYIVPMLFFILFEFLSTVCFTYLHERRQSSATLKKN